jgi:hypothetical protein
LFHVNMAGGHEIIEGAQTGIEGDVLEGAGQAESRDPISRGSGQVVLALEEDMALLRPIEAADAIEDRSLAGAVRTDNGPNFARQHVETDLAERGIPSKMERDVVNVENGRIQCHAAR